MAVAAAIDAVELRSFASHGEDWRGKGDELRQLPQILGGGCQEELVFRSARSAQAQFAEPEDALQVSEEHLDPRSAQQSVLRAQTLSIRIACETPPIPSAMRIQAHCPRSRLRLKFRRRRIPFHASSPGAFFEALGGMLTAHAADRANPTPDELGEVSFQSTRPLANRSSAN
jgi:hypothetical protein